MLWSFQALKAGRRAAKSEKPAQQSSPGVLAWGLAPPARQCLLLETAAPTAPAGPLLPAAVAATLLVEMRQARLGSIRSAAPQTLC